MNHTNIQYILEALKKQECEELKQAVMFHKGEYSWEAKGEKPPIIIVNSNTKSLNVLITKVQLLGNRQLKIEGMTKEQCNHVKVKIDEIPIGQISVIIDHIPPIEGYHSVNAPINFLLYGLTT